MCNCTIASEIAHHISQCKQFRNVCHPIWTTKYTEMTELKEKHATGTVNYMLYHVQLSILHWVSQIISRAMKF